MRRRPSRPRTCGKLRVVVDRWATAIDNLQIDDLPVERHRGVCRSHNERIVGVKSWITADVIPQDRINEGTGKRADKEDEEEEEDDSWWVRQSSVGSSVDRVCNNSAFYHGGVVTM
jgi:hypothetical protein